MATSNPVKLFCKQDTISAENRIDSCNLCNSADNDSNETKAENEQIYVNDCINDCDVLADFIVKNCEYHNVESINRMLNNSSDKNWFFLHLNIRSLQKNIDQLKYFLSQLGKLPDVIAITETKLNDKSDVCNINIDNYNFERCDSPTNAGGTGLYIKSSITYRILPEYSLKMKFVEDIWIEIENVPNNFVVGSIYRHPNYLTSEIEEFGYALQETFHRLNLRQTHYYAMGDYNLDLIRLSNNKPVQQYVNTLISSCCKCMIDIPTRITQSSKTLIDHIYSNDLNHKQLQSGVALLDISDHLGTFLIIPDNSKSSNKDSTKQRLKRNMKNFNIELFLEDLKHNIRKFDMIDSNDMNLPSVHEFCEEFVSTFVSVVNQHAPLQKMSRKERRFCNKPWLTSTLQKAIDKKNKMFHNIVKNNQQNQQIWAEYKKYRNELNRTITLAKKEYFQQKVMKNKTNPSKLWQTIKELVNIKKTTEKSIIHLRNDENKLITDNQQVCDKLNDFFVNIGPKMANSIPILTNKKPKTPKLNCPNSFFLTPVTPEEIESIIRSLKDKKAVRMEDVDTKFIKISTVLIAPILSTLFNICAKLGEFPDCLKIAEVIPIFKKGDVCKATNYRPISLLSQFDKIFEKLLCSRLYNYLEKRDLLSKSQFGFRQNSSTMFAVTSIYENLLKCADRKEFSCSVFLDLSKAFDTVDHSILLHKLKNNFGIRGTPLNLISSYLSNRQQYTKTNGCKSKLTKVTCGVPQGSSLGPLLFLLYINDVPLTTNFNTTLYADDTYLMLSDTNLDKLEKRVNTELEKIDEWLIQNKLSLNYSKTNYLLINKDPRKKVESEFKLNIRDNVLNRYESVKYLGLYIDQNINWNQHIMFVNNQIAKCTGIFYRLKHYVDKSTLLQLYYSLVHSRLQYGLLIWGTATQKALKNLKVGQNKVIRIITSTSRFEHITPFYKQLNILKLNEMHTFELAKFMYRFYNKQLPSLFDDFFTKVSSTHNYSTRYAKNVQYVLPKVTKQLAKNQISFRGLKLWENVKTELKQMNWHNFKKHCKRAYIENY